MGRSRRKRKCIEAAFGQDPLEGYLYYNAGNRLDKVQRFHKAMEEKEPSEWNVDDVTWNDLEMDELFLRINHTNSFIGEQVLYDRLHRLKQADKRHDVKDRTAQEYADFEKRLAYLDEHPKAREEMEEHLQAIGKQEEGYYLAEFLLHSDWWKIGNVYVYHTLQILLVVFLGASILTDSIAALAGMVCVAMVNLMIYLYSKQKYEVYFGALAQFKSVYDFAEWMQKKDKETRLWFSEKTETAVCQLRKMSGVILRMNGRRQASMTGDVTAILAEYIWGVLLIDVSLFYHVMKIIGDKEDAVLQVIAFAGEIDSDIAVLSYRKSVDCWCVPEIRDGALAAEKMAHPLLKNPVANDFCLNKKAIITGTNASGKSTFMKAAAVNGILAQTIHTCIAKRFLMPQMQIVTCMALRDDIQTGESYYFREAKCIKRILDKIAAEAAVLIVIDEILKGTNTKERIAASKAILDHIGRTECFALVATHDNELTENPMYENFYFSSTIREKDIVFDYQIHKGTCRDSNAIALLAYLGYPESIVRKARANLNENR